MQVLSRLFASKVVQVPVLTVTLRCLKWWLRSGRVLAAAMKTQDDPGTCKKTLIELIHMTRGRKEAN